MQFYLTIAHDTCTRKNLLMYAWKSIAIAKSRPSAMWSLFTLTCTYVQFSNLLFDCLYLKLSKLNNNMDDVEECMKDEARETNDCEDYAIVI